jgi:hypothetical protein
MNRTSFGVSHSLQMACVFNGDRCHRSAPPGLDVFQPFSICGTTNQKGTEAAIDTQAFTEENFMP